MTKKVIAVYAASVPAYPVLLGVKLEEDIDVLAQKMGLTLVRREVARYRGFTRIIGQPADRRKFHLDEVPTL